MNESKNIPRFRGNDQIYLAGLLFLFAGLAAQYSWSVALIVIGAILTGVSIGTSFFVTWLSTRIPTK
jgi:phage shock protein PspC (stress-responsive transcriptional regulator)